MTPTELNTFYEVFMMINKSLELVIKRAKKIRADCLDPHIYVTELKSNCCNRATDILEMAESIEKRKKPALKVIEEQRKGLKEDNGHNTQ